MIQIPLSQIGNVLDFHTAVTKHRDALEAHQMGEAGKPAPAAPGIVESVIARVADKGPVAYRKPDRFVILPYQIIDDTPLTPEAQKAIETLRETIQ